MASKFNPAAKSTKRPAVCRKGMFALPIIYLAGLPSSLTVFCSSGRTSGYDDIAESFRLFWDEANARWRGASSENGINIEVTIDELATKDHYDLTLTVRLNQGAIETYTWSDVTIPAGPPFDSGLLTRPAAGGDPELQLHAVN